VRRAAPSWTRPVCNPSPARARSQFTCSQGRANDRLSHDSRPAGAQRCGRRPLPDGREEGAARTLFSKQKPAFIAASSLGPVDAPAAPLKPDNCPAEERTKRRSLAALRPAADLGASMSLVSSVHSCAFSRPLSLERSIAPPSALGRAEQLRPALKWTHCKQHVRTTITRPERAHSPAAAEGSERASERPKVRMELRATQVAPVRRESRARQPSAAGQRGYLNGPSDALLAACAIGRPIFACANLITFAQQIGRHRGLPEPE